jgi:hypothetical protein
MPIRALLTAPLLLVLLLSGCGGGEDEAPEAAATTAPASTAAPKATQATTSSPSTGGSGAGGAVAGLAGFCNDWAQGAAQAAALQNPAAGAAAPANMQQTIETSVVFLREAISRAPAEIRPDLEVYAKFWTEYATALKNANYDFTRFATDPGLQQALQSMSSAELQTASANIAAWAQRNCTR